MRLSRITVLGSTGVAAAVALALAGVDWLDTGTGRQPAMVDSQFMPRPPVARAEAAIERPRSHESARRGLTPQPDVLNLVRSAHTRKAAMEAVAMLADVPGPHADSALADVALTHADFSVREEAVHTLGERGGTIALHTLQQALQDPSPRVREATVRAFVDVGGEEAASALGSALGAADPLLRSNAVDGLGEIGGSDATRYLQQMLQDENDAVREAAAEWLAEFSDESPTRSRRQAPVAARS